MSVTALTICLLLAPQAPGAGPRDAAAVRPAREIRSIPIRDWIAPSPAPLSPRLGSFLGNPAAGSKGNVFLLGRGAELGRGELSRDLIEREAILELVRRFAPDVVDTEGGASVQIEGATLRVSGPPDKVQLIEDTVRKLKRAMVHDIHLQAELFRISKPGAFEGIMTREQLATLRREQQRIWVSSANCVSGNIASLTKDRNTNYVYDVSVEVAQNAKIGDPNTASLFEGVRVAVEPHALTGSRDVVLYAQFAFGELRGPTETRSTGIDDMPSLDVPDIDCNSGTISGRVHDGGALVLSLQGDAAGGGSMVLAISAQQEGNDVGTGEQLGIFPVSALLTPSLRASVHNVQPEDDRAFPLVLQTSTSNSRGLGPVDQASLQDLVLDALGNDLGDEWIGVLGGHLIVKGSDVARQSAERVVRALQDQMLATALVDVRTTLQEVHFGDGVFPSSGSGGGGGDDSDGGRTLHQIAFPALLGRSHVLVRGHESTVIRDNDVEIAQKASLSDPVVDEIFSGIVLSLYVYPQQDGFGAEADLDLFDTATPRRRVAETKDGGDLYLPETGWSRFDPRGPVTSGRYLLLGEGPTVRLGKQSYRTQQLLRITVP